MKLDKRSLRLRLKLGFARYLRTRQTETEKLLWFNLRNKKLNGIKFKRQVVIGKYVVDFVSFEKMLVIELDGGQHNSPNVIIKDKDRTKYLEELGYKVVRYWDNDVFNHLEAVLEDILLKASTSPSPYGSYWSFPSKEREIILSLSTKFPLKKLLFL